MTAPNSTANKYKITKLENRCFKFPNETDNKGYN